MTETHITHPERASRRLLLGISTGILAVALLFGGFYVGYKRGVVAGTNVSVTGVINSDSKVKDVDFNLFWEAWQRLEDNHIDADKFSNQDLVYGAISGLAGSFGDPHTVFFPPADAKKFEEDVAGNFGGIGAEIGLNEDRALSVIAPIKGGPAEAKGFKAGDLILKIDGRSTTNMPTEEAVTYIRGAIGTTVTLQMYRVGWAEPRDIQVVRSTIEVPTLDISYKENGTVAFVQLYSFNQNAVDALAKAVKDIVGKKAKGIVLDLRNDPGGYLEVAIDVAGLFVENGKTVVSERFKDGTSQPFVSAGAAALKNIPLVVLINGGSASAAEILAGALRDIRGVKLVGEKSYGKGTVQEIQHLSDNSSMKITIARWVMPAGGVLDKIGLTPDYVVQLTDEDVKAKKDAQLEKALEVLNAQLR